MPIPATWSRTAQRTGLASAYAISAVGLLYVTVILAWLVLVAAPSEPIADPYLWVMETLTIASGLALLGFCAAVASLCAAERRVLGLLTLASGTLAAGITLSVHFTQLTAVRQLWRAGMIEDYRLIWPSPLFAAEYLAWDLLVGSAMILAGASLGERPECRRARIALTFGGLCCVAGLAGPLSGRMLLQNVAVVGYAIVLPLAAYLTAGVFKAEQTSEGSAV